MTSLEAVAWSRQMFDEVGPYVRSAMPRVLMATHSLYAANQVALGLPSADPYGLMWLGMPKALVEELEGVAGVQVYRPRRGRYRLPLINGVPLIPWRYAKDRATDIDQVPFGKPVSASKKSLFEPIPDQLELPLGEAGLGDAVLADLTAKQRQELDAYGEEIKALAMDRSPVAVLAYASNPDALLRCFFGYAELGPGDILAWIYREELELPSSKRQASLGGAATRPSFDDGQPATPLLRPRTPLESAPTGERPVTPEETATDD